MAITGAPELLIVMGASATQDQVDEVVARLDEAGLLGARHARARGDRDRRDRRAGAARDAAARGLRRRRAGAADPQAVQARLTRAVARSDRDRGAWPPHRRRLLRLHRRPVHGRDAGADARDGTRRRRRGRDDAPRRRLQAAHVAVRVPGARRGGARDPEGGTRRDRAAARHRAHGSAPRRGRSSRPRT